MPSHLVAFCFDANDPPRLANFWAGVLRRDVIDDPVDGIVLEPNQNTEFPIRFLPTDAVKSVPNQVHFDLTSTSLDDQRETVSRALALGARHLDIGQGPDATHVVLADPEGNEFDVIPPGNNFLAGCGFIGALSSDGSRDVGCFWAEALGWPLVWDQDQETAIQSPRGGSKISWGGPPIRPKTGKNRHHFDIAPALDGEEKAEVDRLVSLGATRIDIGHGEVGWVNMADPDGNEFCVTTPR